ncbi:MAG: hypothetical protein JWP01_1996 [Myxococcales bacterium]|nr:hypothetical protein [Myxococcales bacterium]
MRIAAIAATIASTIVTAAAGLGTAAADPLPPGSLGLAVGAISGAGEDAKALGYGYLLGGQAAWQPMNTESRLGWSIKSTLLFGSMRGASAARVKDELLTLQMDVMIGLRIRAGDQSRYLSARIGGALFRADQVIPPEMQRAFAGAVGSIGLDQYFSGWLINIDVRYGLIGPGPATLGLVIGGAKTGP